VGLLNVAKGQDLVLEALARPECRALHVLFAGDGAWRAELERRAAELGLGPRARFLGWRDDVPALVAACDFVLLPSRWEGLPYAVLEAFAAARPVVATPVDGARSLVADGRTGVLARAIAADALAEACARMCALDATQRAELGRAGRELVLAEHTAARMVDALVRVYEEVACASST
jgi:glycosyltransferase involved in cell wall biosynthesis